MRTREQILDDAQFHAKGIPGIPSVTWMLKLLLEVLLDIRESTNKS